MVHWHTGTPVAHRQGHRTQDLLMHFIQLHSKATVAQTGFVKKKRIKMHNASQLAVYKAE